MMKECNVSYEWIFALGTVIVVVSMDVKRFQSERKMSHYMTLSHSLIFVLWLRVVKKKLDSLFERIRVDSRIPKPSCICLRNGVTSSYPWSWFWTISEVICAYVIIIACRYRCLEYQRGEEWAQSILTMNRGPHGWSTNQFPVWREWQAEIETLDDWERRTGATWLRKRSSAHLICLAVTTDHCDHRSCSTCCVARPKLRSYISYEMWTHNVEAITDEVVTMILDWVWHLRATMSLRSWEHQKTLVNGLESSMSFSVRSFYVTSFNYSMSIQINVLQNRSSNCPPFFCQLWKPSVKLTS